MKKRNDEQQELFQLQTKNGYYVAAKKNLRFVSWYVKNE